MEQVRAGEREMKLALSLGRQPVRLASDLFFAFVVSEAQHVT